MPPADVIAYAAIEGRVTPDWILFGDQGCPLIREGDSPSYGAQGRAAKKKEGETMTTVEGGGPKRNNWEEAARLVSEVLPSPVTAEELFRAIADLKKGHGERSTPSGSAASSAGGNH